MTLKDEFPQYWEGCRKAAKEVLKAGEDEYEKALYPYWRDAIHELILSKYCPCQDGKNEKCFLALSKNIQMKLITEKMPLLNFENFIKISFRSKIS